MNLPEKILANKKAELKSVVSSMIEGQMHLIEGIRKICRLRFDIGQPDHEVFIPIRGVDSETDHFPLGALRTECAPEYLKRIDAEMDKYIAEARQEIVTACEEILKAFP